MIPQTSGAETPEITLISQSSSKPMTVRDIQVFNGVITSLAVSEVNNILLVSTRDGTVTGVNLQDLQPLYAETFVNEPRSLVITADQNTFITASDKEIRLFNLQDGVRGKRWVAHAGKITKLALSPGNELLASISAEDGTAKLWQLKEGSLLQTFGEHTGPLTAVTFSPNGKLLVTGASGTDRTLKFWDTEAFALIRTSPQQPGYIYDLAITSDGNKLVAAVRNTIKIWDLNTGQELLTVKAAELNLNAIAVSPNNQWVATANKEGTISLIDITQGKIIGTLKGHKGWVTSVMFSDDGRYLYSGAEDKIVKIWDFQGNQP
ncbi:WD40 repeat domain-containing protein [Crocosphaera sp. UHCC 0190]|uniref:WD40 repeat domain-containing protein n=1 Tax=Crocosphaera sp. UHCC 0190 TaxID=3110246 RepID=UPI002B20546D|nr:WD40 repeat domain-containing protein [Crocosphaera sp. UHCC 0190]MEA5509510.1 WD40 repeat domain-containing protein [Crocosphaera sp. UHCC 0190]